MCKQADASDGLERQFEFETRRGNLKISTQFHQTVFVLSEKNVCLFFYQADIGFL